MSATKPLPPGPVPVSPREQECASISPRNPYCTEDHERQSHAGPHECEYSIEPSSLRATHAQVTRHAPEIDTRVT